MLNVAEMPNLAIEMKAGIKFSSLFRVAKRSKPDPIADSKYIEKNAFLGPILK